MGEENPQVFCSNCGWEVADNARFCHNCGGVLDLQSNEPLDTYGKGSHSDQIPELEIVGFWTRTAAWAIDAIPFFFESSLLGPFVFPAWLAYRIALIVIKGQTIGKLVCKIQVVNKEGANPNIG